MQYSTNYHFKLPAPSDFVNVNDLSENFGSIDGLIKGLTDGKIEAVTGSYVGTGATGTGSPNVLNLGFQPKLVIISRDGVAYSTAYSYMGVYVDGTGAMRPWGGNVGNEASVAEPSINGLSWYYNGSASASNKPQLQLNASGATYHYIAFA